MGAGARGQPRGEGESGAEKRSGGPWGRGEAVVSGTLPAVGSGSLVGIGPRVGKREVVVEAEVSGTVPGSLPAAGGSSGTEGAAAAEG